MLTSLCEHCNDVYEHQLVQAWGSASHPSVLMEAYVFCRAQQPSYMAFGHIPYFQPTCTDNRNLTCMCACMPGWITASTNCCLPIVKFS